MAINEGGLGRWMSRWQADNSEPENALSPAERGRVAAIDDEIGKILMGIEFLKRAVLSSRSRCNTGVW